MNDNKKLNKAIKNRDSFYAKAKVPKVRLKKFNLKEELIESGWEKPKQSGYKAKVFRAMEWFLSLLGIGSLIWLNLYRGFLNFTVAGLTTIPLIVLGVAAFALGEFMFYFMFLHGRHRKLSFLKETVPYKTIAYIVGGVTAVISPVAAILVALIVPFVLNQKFADWVTRSNFDRRAEYYEPTTYAEPPVDYEEPVRPAKGYQAPKVEKPKKQNKGDSTDIQLSANLNDGPQISAIAPREWGAHYDTLNKDALDKEYDDCVLDVNSLFNLSKKVDSFCKKWF